MVLLQFSDIFANQGFEIEVLVYTGPLIAEKVEMLGIAPKAMSQAICAALITAQTS